MPTDKNETQPASAPKEPFVGSALQSESHVRLEYHDRISGMITETKLWRFGFKKGYKITSIDFNAPDFKTADALAKDIALKFGVRYVYVRPAVFDVSQLLKMDDLPNYI